MCGICGIITKEETTFNNQVSEAKKIKDFAILSPLCSNKHYPNYKVLNPNKNNIIRFV